ncbi:Fibronectin type III domain protein [Beutenbergia cavernae DSM 12333]|uniref:Fibronectin type III domain protein n=1 Tax=Beutenbergia cavernae (strain ATCC BAA-8 / DSM 12333 / CCUG 43141 / JCM 11478 / NBRC 16432 / NCIMB 13614 / HKI 0122) TaxID=471853 RepID=C5C5Z9_BEUC1|nr:fibronectin type III domain-containing protein [Beutenbergia cavernae]ACQ82357.1 Fibronectin type III domain protein [Beutenbergia cavernae DSM 12333]
MRNRARIAAAVGAATIALCLTAPAAVAADTTPPTAPSNVRILDVDPDMVTIAFTGSTDAGGLKWYTVHNGSRSQATTSPSRTEFGGLQSGTTYSLTVRAVDRAGNVSAPSAPVTFTTPTWPAVTGLRVTSTSGGTVDLAWDRYSAMDPYRFLVYDAGDGEALTKYERMTLRGLAPGVHTFTVRGFHVSGSVTAASNTVTVTVPPRGTDRTAPSAPTNATVLLDEESYEFTTTWTASTDPVDPPSALRYDILQLWAGDYFTAAYGIAGTTYQGAFASAVRAVDPAGNRSPLTTTVTIG